MLLRERLLARVLEGVFRESVLLRQLLTPKGVPRKGVLLRQLLPLEGVRWQGVLRQEKLLLEGVRRQDVLRQGLLLVERVSCRGALLLLHGVEGVVELGRGARRER